MKTGSSTLAPILGFQGGEVPEGGYTVQIADTAPGLVGLYANKSVQIQQLRSVTWTVSAWAGIPCEGIPFGTYVQHDFAHCGETYMVRFEDYRDLSRLSFRLRDHQGTLVKTAHPGLTVLEAKGY